MRLSRNWNVASRSWWPPLPPFHYYASERYLCRLAVESTYWKAAILIVKPVSWSGIEQRDFEFLLYNRIPPLTHFLICVISNTCPATHRFFCTKPLLLQYLSVMNNAFRAIMTCLLLSMLLVDDVNAAAGCVLQKCKRKTHSCCVSTDHCQWNGKEKKCEER